MLTLVTIVSLLVGLNPAVAATPQLTDQGAGADNTELAQPANRESGALTALGAPTSTLPPYLPRAVYTKEVTAFSSTPDETDDTPFVTASGVHVHEGTVAANWLPFGTKIRIPAISETATFIVEDRMNSRYSDRIDVWFPEKAQAKNFGVHSLRIEVL